MADTVFFSGKKKTDSRIVIMKSATLLVGKEPEQVKRIKIACVMPLTAPQVKNAPEWLLNAYEYVAKNHDVVNFPDLKLTGMSVELDDDNLFESSVKIPKSTLNRFVVHEIGSEEEPDLELSFTMYAPFSSALWRHIGQYGGKDQYARFEQIEAPAEESDNLTLTGDADAVDDDDETEDDD